MPTVADYAVLTDASFELTEFIELGSSQGRLDFQRPDNFVEGTNLAKPVLIYQVRPGPEARYEVHINHPFGADLPNPNRVHEAADIGGGRWRTMYEPVNGTLFEPGLNSFKFHVTRGEARFADVILMYQVEV